MQEFLNHVDKGLELPSTEGRCKGSVKKFERSPTVGAEWIELKKILAKFQVERGKETFDDRGPMIWHQKPDASGNQMQAQWSVAAEAWLELTCGILSPTCQSF